MADKTRLGLMGSPTAPYGVAADNVLDPKPPSGIIEPESTGSTQGPRRKIGIGPK